MNGDVTRLGCGLWIAGEYPEAHGEKLIKHKKDFQGKSWPNTKKGRHWELGGRQPHCNTFVLFIFLYHLLSFVL